MEGESIAGARGSIHRTVQHLETQPISAVGALRRGTKGARFRLPATVRPARGPRALLTTDGKLSLYRTEEIK